MSIWYAEIKEVERYYESFKGHHPDLEKELEKLITSEDENMVLLYSRRSLEVIITDLCETELKRPRKTEPLKGIIDKLNKEEKVPAHIITSMDHLNGLSTYGAHPKEYDPQQLKPVLNNLAIIIRWYLKYKDRQTAGLKKKAEEKEEIKQKENTEAIILNSKRKLIFLLVGSGLSVFLILGILVLFKIIGGRDQIADLKSLEKSIAVLAFTDMSPGHDQEYLGDGIAQEILEKLTKFSDLKVIARASSFSFKGKNEDIRQIGKKLNVENILTGSVRKEENLIRVTVELISASTGRMVYSEPYNYESKKILSLESDIAVDVAQKIKLKLSSGAKPEILTNKEVNPEAYEAFLKGRMEINKGPIPVENQKNARKYFQIAAAIDPGFAEAFAFLSFAYINLSQFSYTLKEKRTMVDSANYWAEKALELNENNYLAHFAKSNVYAVGYDLINYMKEINKAYEINPVEAKMAKALNIILLDNEDDKGVSLAKEAAISDPLNIDILKGYYNTLFFTGRYDECISISNQVVALDSNQWDAHATMGWCYLFKNEIKKGLQEWSKCMLGYGKPDLAHLFLTTDFKTAMEAFFKWQLSENEGTILGKYGGFAYIYSYFNDRENTIKYLELACNDNEDLTMLRIWPGFDFIKKDPAFQKIYEKTGFKAYDEYKKSRK